MQNMEENNSNTLDKETEKIGKDAVNTVKSTKRQIRSTVGLGKSIVKRKSSGSMPNKRIITKGTNRAIKDTTNHIENQEKKLNDFKNNENMGIQQGNRKMDRRQFHVDTLNKMANVNEISKLQHKDGTLRKARQDALKKQKKMADSILKRKLIKIKIAIITAGVAIGIGILIIAFIGSLLYAHDDRVVEKSSESIGSRDMTQDVEIVQNEDGTSSYEIKGEVYEDFAKAVESDDINLDAIAVTYGDGTVDENGVLDRDDQLEELMNEIDTSIEEDESNSQTQEVNENEVTETQSEDAKIIFDKKDTFKVKKELFDLQKSSKAIMASIELATTGATTDSDNSDSAESKTSIDSDEESDYQVYSKYLQKMVEAYIYTTLPNLGGDQPNSGMVKVIRRSYKAEDTDRYEDDETPNPDKEILLSYMKKAEFDEKLEKLEESYNENDYNELRNYFTISYDSGITTSGEAGTGQTSGDIVYDISLAGATKSPSEFGITSTKISDVRTTVYTSSAEENARTCRTNIIWNRFRRRKAYYSSCNG